MLLPSMPNISLSLPLHSFGAKPVQQSRSTPSLSAKSSSQSMMYSSSDDDRDEDGGRSESPVGTNVTCRPGAVRKRSARPKTSFQLAHPVTTHRRLRLRPKLLLQLQQSGQLSRPVPKYDVLPATVAPRLVCKLPKLFEAVRGGLGPRDLVVVTSDMYDQHLMGEDDRSVSSDESSTDQREVVATICQPSKDDAMRGCQVVISLSTGVSWEGTSLPSGSYEFRSQGQSPARKVRWVARDKGHRRASGISPGADGSSSKKRFAFSVIDPNTRRHPVIGSMTRSSIDVYDQYSLPPIVSRDETTAFSASLAVSVGEAGQELINMEEELRTLIVITGTWIAFMEGWSKNPYYPEMGNPSESPLSPSGRSITLPRLDRDVPSERKSRRSMTMSHSQPGLAPTVQSFAEETSPTPSAAGRSATRNRRASHRSTQLERLQSDEAAAHDSRWTDLKHQGDEVTDRPDHVPDTSHRGHPQEDNPGRPASKTKSKGWRRFSSIFGKKK